MLSGYIFRTCLLALMMATAQSSFATVIGDVAPSFDFLTIDGKPLSLSDYQGEKAVYLVFWNTWCSYCIKKTPRYKKLEEKFGDRIEIIAINTGWSDSQAEMEQYQNQHGTNYLLVFDNEEVITKRYKVRVVPTEFIIDIDGIVRYRDHVPKYIAAHIPDWFQPYVPGKDHGSGLVNACEIVASPAPTVPDILAGAWFDDFK